MSAYSLGRVVLGGGTAGTTPIADTGPPNQDNVLPNGVFSNASQYVWNPALQGGSGGMERLRTASKQFDSGNLIAAVNATAIWTPAAGKKFRLMAYMLMIPSHSTLAAGAATRTELRDAGFSIGGIRYDPFVPAAAGPVGPPLLLAIVILPGNGYLSVAANNSLSIFNATAYTAGGIDVNLWGTEE